MSVTAVASNQGQALSSSLLQQVLASESGSTGTSASSGLLGDLLTLSPAAQQLTQAPDDVTQAMKDLFSGQKDVSGDLAKLRTYFQKNPQSLVSLLNTLQGGVGTYGSTNSSSAKNALLTALVNGQSNSSDPSALLGLLLGNQGQNSLFNYLGNSSNSSNSNPLSILG